jgi:hypothetical protein
MEQPSNLRRRCDLPPDDLFPDSDLLDAVLSFRDFVKAALSEPDRKSLECGEEVYIGVLAAGGWECKSTPHRRLQGS